MLNTCVVFVKEVMRERSHEGGIRGRGSGTSTEKIRSAVEATEPWRERMALTRKGSSPSSMPSMSGSLTLMRFLEVLLMACSSSVSAISISKCCSRAASGASGFAPAERTYSHHAQNRYMRDRSWGPEQLCNPSRSHLELIGLCIGRRASWESAGKKVPADVLSHSVIFCTSQKSSCTSDSAVHSCMLP